MSKKLLNEIHRLQRLAGLVKENNNTENPNLTPPEGVGDEEKDYGDDVENISAGERRALAQGLQLMTKPQMAALYLTALEKYEDARGKYIVMIPGLKSWGRKDDSGALRVSVVNLKDALGLDSYQTALRTIRKFENILKGIGGTEDEIIYPKIIKAAAEFKSMNPRDVAMMAGDAIKEPPIGGPRRSGMPSEDPKKLAQRVDFLVKSLMKIPQYSDRAKAERMAISKIAKERNTDEFKVAKAYQSFAKIKETQSD